MPRFNHFRKSPSSWSCVVGALLVVCTSTTLSADNQQVVSALERTYASSVKQIVSRYCFDCHGPDLAEAELDLSTFETLADARENTKAWLKVRMMLDSAQMPPKDADQPTDEERAQLAKWVKEFLTAEALAHAGDPGPVVLRRLSNAEYTYTLRDLTGVDSLDPAREFPVDGAAGEGFTNVGNGQGMSPALVQKYLDAAKSVAEHAVLTSDGIRFSQHTTERDQTDELLAKIQAFYREYTNDGGGRAVDLQGIRFDTNQGGLLPLETYLAATLQERDALRSQQKTIKQVAQERSLSPKYLALLWSKLESDKREQPSFLLDDFRAQWTEASADDAASLAGGVSQMQNALWKFNTVGQIGRPDGPKQWMEPVSPTTTQREFRLKLPTAPANTDIVFHLKGTPLGDSEAFVVWQHPRFEIPARGDQPRSTILLRDVRHEAAKSKGSIAADAKRAAQYLGAVAQLHTSGKSTDEIAQSQGLDTRVLSKWTSLVRLGEREQRDIAGMFSEKLTNRQFDAVRGWGSDRTPCMLTNRSDKPIQITTLTLPARGVTIHPSPELESFVAFRSPISGQVRLSGLVADADDKCGNGAAWRLEIQNDSGRTQLAAGVIENSRREEFSLDKPLEIREGDIVSLLVNARDRSHICDTTHVELHVVEVAGEKRKWNLAEDVVDGIHNGNPLPDSQGHARVWHFGAIDSDRRQPAREPLAEVISPDSILAQWRDSLLNGKPQQEIDALAVRVQEVLTADESAKLSLADRRWRDRLLPGVPPILFGRTPRGPAIGDADLWLAAPTSLAVRVPAEIFSEAEFTVGGAVHPSSVVDAAVQLQVSYDKPTSLSKAALAISADNPIFVRDNEQSQQITQAAVQEFRELFPPALCYARIVPVDEVVTLKIFYREDDHLQRLMLDDRQSAELDRLWDELFFVSEEPLKLAVSLEQIAEFATQDNPAGAKAFNAMRDDINDRADAFRERLVKTEPAHVSAALDFAQCAWRRPVSNEERESLQSLYLELRDSGIAHDSAIRLLLARILTAPAFLYKLEEPASGDKPAPVGDMELASRLSYFLWSSQPDGMLRTAAEQERLTGDAELLKQTRRMLRDERTRRLALQFACQWLHVRDFDQNDDKNEQLYPQFATLRGDMHEETVRFFADMIQNDGSILEMLNADHTFVNAKLAKHYGLPTPVGDVWQRVDGVRNQGRGGVLAMASVLASQSGASRTSPILRGNWVYETLLGELLPRPPANVPQLPDEVPQGLSARQLIERHSSDAACAKCHARIDPYGFALEQYDAIGRLRSDRTDTATTLFSGEEIDGIDGLRDYLLKNRRDDFVRQFCRKLTGYALGREVQLSDEPLLDEIQARLTENDFRFSVAVETIVLSNQFRHIRGSEPEASE